MALAWDSHVHHLAARQWFAEHGRDGWATCPVTESGFVRVSCHPRLLPHPLDVASALEVLRAMRAAAGHRFLVDDVSVTAADVPALIGHRQVTDAHLLTLARRHSTRLVTFDSGLAALGAGHDVELLTTP